MKMPNVVNRENCTMKGPMPKWWQECLELGETVKSYKRDVLTFRLEYCKWVDEFVAEASKYILETKQSTNEFKLPKTPSLKVRSRKRIQNRIEEDVENAPSPRKSPCTEAALKEISVCLTRIDVIVTTSTQEKPMTPTKPPRRLKLAADLTQNYSQHSVLSPETKPSIGTVVLKDSTNSTLNRPEQISGTIKQKIINFQPNRGTFQVAELNLKRMSVSHRRSSLMRHKIRNLRRSQRLSERRESVMPRDSLIQIENIEELNDSDFKREADNSTVEIGVAKCEENVASVPQAIVVKKHVTEPENPDKVPDRRSSKRLANGNVQDTENNTSKQAASGNFSQDSLDGLSNDVNTIIPKTPSPVCPSDKVVRPKLNVKKLGMSMKSKSTVKVNKHMASHVPRTSFSTSVAKTTTHPKGYGNGSTSKVITKVRSSSILAGRYSNSMARLSPKPMTPLEKQDKAREQLLLREMKTKENLRRRDEKLKKKMEEQRRRREEKTSRAIQMREHQQKLEEARLAKAREQEEERVRLKAHEKQKAQEEQEKRRLAAEKQIREKEWEDRRLKKELRKKERLLNLEMIRIKNEEMISAEEKQLNASATVIEKKNAMNSTFVLEDNNNDNYDMTPQQTYPKRNIDENNYDISQLKEGDSTDEESQPKKEIPNWAQGHAFKKAVIYQLRTKVDYSKIFPPDELMLLPNLSEIFQTKKKLYNHRTSSAIWSSPVWKNDTSNQ